jgi:hypothetical protein
MNSACWRAIVATVLNVRTSLYWRSPGFNGATTELAGIGTGVIAIENIRLFTELEARNREILSRYFSPDLARRLAGGADEIGLAGQRREVAAIFTDLESFTSLIARMEPGTLSDLLDGYLSGMTSLVLSHEGTVAKIVGDALHILFGAPGDQPDHAARAIACALDLDDFAQSFRETWQQKSTGLGPTRIGVHAGPASVGNFGGGASLTTLPMATPSTPPPDSRRPTSRLEHESAGARVWRRKYWISAAVPWAI